MYEIVWMYCFACWNISSIFKYCCRRTGLFKLFFPHFSGRLFNGASLCWPFDMTLMGQRHEALALICTRGDLGASFPCFANTLWGVQSSFEPPKGFLEGLSGVPTPPQKVFWTFWKTIEILRHIAAQGLRFMAVQSPHFCVQACQHKICLCCIGLYWHSVRCGKFG